MEQNKHNFVDHTGTVIRPGMIKTNGIDQRMIIASSWAFPKTLLFTYIGRIPSQMEIDLLNAVLNAYMSHGLTPSSSLMVLLALISN